MFESIRRFYRSRLDSIFRIEESSLPPGLRRLLLRTEKLLILTLQKTSRDLCLERAASLAFSFTVCLVPLAVLIFLVLITLGSFDEPIARGREFVLGVFTDLLGASRQGGEAAEERAETVERVKEILNALEESLIAPIRDNRGKVGPIAILFLVLSALGLYRTAERNFSAVWNVSQGRSFLQSLGSFWLMVTGIPLILGTSFAAQAVAFAEADLGWFLSAIRDWVLPVSIAFFAFMLLFLHLPHTRVRLDAAAPGALISAILWQVGTLSFYFYVQVTFGRGTGAFAQLGGVYWVVGTLPLFLFWVYFSWLIALLGAEFAYCLQNFASLEREARFKVSEQHLSRPVQGLLIMGQVYRSFRDRGDPGVTGDLLASELHIPHELVERLVTQLRSAQLVVVDERGRITPSRSADQIRPIDVVNAFPVGSGYRLPPRRTEESPLESYLRGLGSDLHRSLDQRTFAELLSPRPAEESAPRLPETPPS